MNFVSELNVDETTGILKKILILWEEKVMKLQTNFWYTFTNVNISGYCLMCFE
jgi:hypothetical protein